MCERELPQIEKGKSVPAPQPPKPKFSILNVNHPKFKYLAILVTSFIAVAIVTALPIYFLSPRPSEDDTEYIQTHPVYYKDQWGGKPAGQMLPMEHPVKLVIVSHSATDMCFNFTACSASVRGFQEWHLHSGYSDIGYNFIIGGDGGIYVGRGWDFENFHKQTSIGINFVGEFNYDIPTDGMVDTALALIGYGVKKKKLSYEYMVVGHNQTNGRLPLSPGENLYKVIKEWDHFFNGTLFE